MGASSPMLLRKNSIKNDSTRQRSCYWLALLVVISGKQSPYLYLLCGTDLCPDAATDGWLGTAIAGGINWGAVGG